MQRPRLVSDADLVRAFVQPDREADVCDCGCQGGKPCLRLVSDEAFVEAAEPINLPPLESPDA